MNTNYIAYIKENRMFYLRDFCANLDENLPHFIFAGKNDSTKSVLLNALVHIDEIEEEN